MISGTRLLLAFFPLTLSLTLQSSHYTEIKLVASDNSFGAQVVDPRLINPWGLTFNRHGDFFVADNDASTVLATSYEPNGSIRAFNVALVEELHPTGLELNTSDNHFIFGTAPIGPARLLFSTETGKILAFSSKVNRSTALVVYDGAVDQSSSPPVYKGLALGQSGGHWFIFAADFHNNKVDVFDTNFNLVNSFTDPNIPSGYAPFNIQNFDGSLYVTFAKQLAPDNSDDEAGAGHGYVDIFGTNGTFNRRLISQGVLNSPWGLVIAPKEFGEFSHALLVGNFGDGLINAFNAQSGSFLGTLEDVGNNPITIEGLWSLKFQPHHHHDDIDGQHQDDDDDHEHENPQLIFTAGPEDESAGLVGKIILH